MSRSGMLWRTRTPPKVDARVDVIVDLPSVLPDVPGAQLRAHARVVRTSPATAQGGETLVGATITSYSFVRAGDYEDDDLPVSKN